jgi:signal transduction histidine kinase
MTDAFAAVDHEWRVITINRKHESLFRRSRADVIGRVLWDVFPGSVTEVGLFGELRRAAAQRVIVEFEEYCGALDVWLECRACPREGGLDIFARDVTARHRRVEEAPATRRRDEVLGIVAHDLRNHLNAIRASSKVALVMGDRNPRRPIETIDRVSARMERLIRDLLDVSAIENGTLAIDSAAVRPADVLAEAIDAHVASSAELSIELSADCRAELPDVAADFQRLLQVLGNLLGNAIKFTGPGGRIVAGAARDGEHVRFWVSDTGPGIPAERVPYIFDKFSPHRARPRDGIGLGLAICKAIVDTHGGRIWVDSHVGMGTTVHFTMPVDAEHEAYARRACTQHQRGAPI